MSIAGLNCDGQQNELKAYPDIAGAGVLIGFLGTAYLAVIITVGYFCLAFDPDKDPFGPSDTPADDSGMGVAVSPSPSWAGNRVDKHIIDFIARYIIKVQLQSDGQTDLVVALENAFNRCVLQLCDAQLMTGLGIMAAAYASLNSGLSAYHWQVAVYLAWFANLTHLSGLTFLRKYLHNHDRGRKWRLALMTLLFLMLLVGEVPTAFFNWPNAYDSLVEQYRSSGVKPATFLEEEGVVEATAANASSFAWCFFNVVDATRQYQDQRDMLREFPPYQFTTTGPFVYFEDVTELEGSTAFQSALVSIVLLSFGFFTRAVKVSKPLVTLVYWLVVSVVWGTLHIITLHGSIDRAAIEEESSFTFGQILPVLLLAGPFLAALVTLQPAILPLVRAVRSSRGPEPPHDPLTDTRIALAALSHPTPAHVAPAPTTPAPRTTRAQEELEPFTWATDIADLFQRDYYHEVWAAPTIALGALQIVFVTAYIFRVMSENISALKAFVGFLVWFFIVQPTACYAVILAGMASKGLKFQFVERLADGHLKTMLTLSEPHFWWMFCLLVFSTYSISPIYGWGVMSVGNGKNYEYLIISISFMAGIVFTYSGLVCIFTR
ncbi:hypothetical protein B0T25DRAFT_604039 [Lasiosphaeria hispida]|uniref:Uncharacterized protein n=1 Tax=Lasiosphaeria hispida TaxID=260671 RepID=A0AAJ0HM38_9PEZI|nr:hypothetical protein B0T25DRAFT_604039 [Lasiosphaeria hispida]